MTPTETGCVVGAGTYVISSCLASRLESVPSPEAYRLMSSETSQDPSPRRQGCQAHKQLCPEAVIAVLVLYTTEMLPLRDTNFAAFALRGPDFMLRVFRPPDIVRLCSAALAGG
ncbi:hypothetical protein CSOJ01_01829 [Colletotrichum sojae]|uniref:Uncharacterized protein n=1 Tax=Colletotrichum sojae TaxID=2175907 RepID=A0A8H6N305_9PEZI|nr:hypothetical protein CSOJ01_01829 [Colletotrichum sojae]